jgi:hypothetical protein
LIFYETSVFTENNIGIVRYGQDFEIALMDLATGQGLQLNPPEFGGTETYGATVRQAIAEVEFDSNSTPQEIIMLWFPENFQATMACWFDVWISSA